jgi:hypothetical protein
MKTKKEIKWLNGELSSKEIEDLKQSEDLERLKDSALCFTFETRR